MHITRRLSIVSTLAVALAACANNGTNLIDPNVLADAAGLVTSTQALVAALQKYDPDALTPAQAAQIAALQTAATTALNSLSAATPVAAGSGALQTIDNYLNTALQAVGAALPAAAVAFPALEPYVVIYDAAVGLIVGVVEPYINSVITTIAPAAAHQYHVIHNHYTTAQSRAILHIH